MNCDKKKHMETFKNAIPRFSSLPTYPKALLLFPFHLWLGILLWARDQKPCTDWYMAGFQHLPCLLSLSSSDPMGMKNLRRFHGSLWKIPNRSFFEKGDITSELPHVAIMDFCLCEWIFSPDIEKMRKLNPSAIKTMDLTTGSEYALWERELN